MNVKQPRMHKPLYAEIHYCIDCGLTYCVSSLRNDTPDVDRCQLCYDELEKQNISWQNYYMVVSGLLQTRIKKGSRFVRK